MRFWKQYYLVLTLVGCTAATDLPDIFQRSDYQDPPGASLRFIHDAPIVVVGSVTAVQEIGRAKSATQDPELLIQLTRISLNVENIIRGDVPIGKLDFYCYTFSNQNRVDLARLRFVPRTGDRRVFFVKAFNGGYRSVGDVTDYTIPVKSGFHSRDFCHDDSVGNCIAKILLMPGKVYDSETYAVNLRKATSTAELIASGELTFQLLQQLSQSTDPKVAAAAQRVLRGELTR